MPNTKEPAKRGRPPKPPAKKYRNVLITLSPGTIDDLRFISELLGIPKSRALRLAFYGFFWEGLPDGKRAKAEYKRLIDKYNREESAYYRKVDAKGEIGEDGVRKHGKSKRQG